MVEPGDILSLHQSTYSNILDQLQMKDLFKGKEASQTSGGLFLSGRKRQRAFGPGTMASPGYNCWHSGSSAG
jgi:hypothetical protein